MSGCDLAQLLVPSSGLILLEARPAGTVYTTQVTSSTRLSRGVVGVTLAFAAAWRCFKGTLHGIQFYRLSGLSACWIDMTG